eukprot:6686746-Lingulodinium_polyedra.AAC.1
MPEWASDIAKARRHFKDTMLVQKDGESRLCYKFLYAVQKPKPYVALGRASYVDEPIDLTEEPTVANIDSIDRRRR